MNFKVSINKILGIIVNFVGVVLAMSLLFSNEDVWKNCSLLLYTSIIITNIILIKRINKTFANFFELIYIVIVMFHLSQIYLLIFKDNSYQNILNYCDMKTTINAFTFSFVCIHIMTFAYYLFHKQVDVEKTNKIDISVKEKKLISYLFCILIIFKVYLSFSQFLLARASTYVDSLKTLTSGIDLINSFANVIIIIYINFCVLEKNRKKIFFIVIFIEIIFMFSGSRINSVCNLLMLFLTTYSNKLEKNKTNGIFSKNAKRTFIIVLCGIIGIAFLTGIRYAREYYSEINFKSITESIINHNILVETIKEFGGTQLNTIIAIKYKDDIQKNNGDFYLDSLLTILPNINGIFSEKIYSLYYVNVLKKFLYWNYGGSIICEAFMAFKYWGCLVFFIYGLFLAKIENMFKKRNSKNVVYNIFIILLCYKFLGWMRGYFFSIFRTAIWCTLLYIMLRTLLLKKDFKEN